MGVILHYHRITGRSRVKPRPLRPRRLSGGRRREATAYRSDYGTAWLTTVERALSWPFVLTDVIAKYHVAADRLLRT